MKKQVQACAGARQTKTVTRYALAAALSLSIAPTAAIAEVAGTGTNATNDSPVPALSENSNVSSTEDYSSMTLLDDGAGSTYDLSSIDLSKIKDGTYSATVTVETDDDDSWSSYDIKVNVTIEGGKITAVAVDDDSWDKVPDDSSTYLSNAEFGTTGRNAQTGVAEKIINSQNTNVDVVSKATVASNAIKKGAYTALTTAYNDQNPVTDEYTYGYVGLTWAQYWANEGVYNATDVSPSSEVDSKGETDKGGFDVVSRATTNHGLHRGSYQQIATIYTTGGQKLVVNSWESDGSAFYTPDGTKVGYNRGSLTYTDGSTDAMDHYEVSGIKYVPVAVKTSELEDFEAAGYTLIENGSTLAGGYGENNLQAYSVTADVTEETYGLKTATKTDGGFTFSARSTEGTESGIEGQALKSASPTPSLRSGDDVGSFGEFIRLDLVGDYGDLGANMQSVTWTYYGSDSTYSTALRTYGTKFAADNWMHKKNGIQLGLTDSVRCQLPDGTDGTGYWTVTVRALGYEDYTYSFEATSDNIAKEEPVTEETKAKLQDLYDQAAALTESDYTDTSWASFLTELNETKDLLAKSDLTEAAATEQMTHLQSAIDALVKVETDDYTYGYVGLSWAEYWANENVYAAGDDSSSSTTDYKGETDKGAFDVVTRATTNHGLHRGSYQCTATIYTTGGQQLVVNYWESDGSAFYTPDGTKVGYNRGTLTCTDGTTDTMDHYEVSGIKYVPVAVKTSELDDLKAAGYTFVESGSKLAGGYGEKNLEAYSVTADVTKDTYGLKTATKINDGFTFSARSTSGTESGIKGQALKSVDESKITVTVKDASGSYGEFLRVDITNSTDGVNGYGDLGANMQSVTWTYYGSDSTYNTPLQSYGTKFAADNWMHKSMGIQLGLTDSARCQLPTGTDGTGYWTVTVHALGYEDYTAQIQVSDANIVKGDSLPASKTSIAALQAAYDDGIAIDSDDYTDDSYNALKAELDETKADFLDKYAADASSVTDAAVREQTTHVQDAINGLVAYEGTYVYVNIPYDKFYAAEVGNNGVDVDVYTSATKSKTRMSGLSGGSYHNYDADAEYNYIYGVTYGVMLGKGVTVEDLAKLGGEEVTDSTSYDITTSGKGGTSTTTYTGKDALYEKPSYSYYVVTGDAPTNYKKVTKDESGALVFSEVRGADVTTLEAVSADFSTESNYGDYQLDLPESIKTAMFGESGSGTVYGVVVNTQEGSGYGMRHLENIWRTTEIAWCTGFTTAVHGCPTSSAHYASMMGQTIESVTYYTSAGVFEIPLSEVVYVPVKTDGMVNAEIKDAQKGATETEATISLPTDYDAVYSIENWNTVDVTIDGGKLTIPAGQGNGAYTLKVSDKSKKYADVSVNFQIKINAPVKMNSETAALETTDDSLIAGYVNAIASVKVGDKTYNATGKRSTKLFNEDGSIIATAEPFANLGFGDSVTMTIVADGYNDLEVTYTKTASKTALAAAIASVEKLVESDYTDASWTEADIEAVLASAKAVYAEVTASDEEVANAITALTNAQAKLAKKASESAIKELGDEADKSSSLKESDYTVSSWANYQKALAAAKAVLASDDVSDEEVADALAGLQAAREALTKTSTQQTSDTTNTTNTTNVTNVTNVTNETSKKSIPQTGDESVAGTAGIVAGIGAAIVAAAAAIRRKFNA